MRVDETKLFNDYWYSDEYKVKRPDLKCSIKRAYGDNIYHFIEEENTWYQANSHHSFENGASNIRNIINDTQTNRVLISNRFAYWGRNAIDIPEEFINFNGESLCVGRNHRSLYSSEFVNAVVAWFEALNLQGCLGKPYRWL